MSNRWFVIPLVMLAASLWQLACSPAGSPASTPQPAATENPTGTDSPASAAIPGRTPTASASPTGLPTSAAALTQLPTITPTLAATTEPDWTGRWDIYISTPGISIVNTIRFEVPFGDNLEMQATWVEGTRQVSLTGSLSEDRRTFSGLLFNSDVETLDFSITLLPDGSGFSGAADSPAGRGAICGARPGQPRPNPCRTEP